MRLDYFIRRRRGYSINMAKMIKKSAQTAFSYQVFFYKTDIMDDINL